MNQTGTLRKRGRRILSKVNGLTVAAYDEGNDIYTGLEQTGDHIVQPILTNYLLRRSAEPTTLRLSSRTLGESRQISRSFIGNQIIRVPDIGRKINVKDIESQAEEISGNSNKHNHPNSPAVTDRTFLIKDSILWLLKLMVYLGAIFGTHPWRWNHKTFQIDRRSDRFVKFWRWYVWFSAIQTSAICCLQLHTFLDKLYSENSSNREAFMSSMALLWSTSVVAKNINMYLYEEKTRIYLNALLRFNRIHVQKYVIQLDGHHDGGTLAINKTMFFCDLSQLIISSSLFARMPFQPWYFFSFIYPKPWYWLIPGVVHEVMLTGQSLSFLLLIPWTIVAHANTLQFWLREIHNNNESEFTIDELRAPRNAIETYKSMQVLNVLFNDCMAPMAIPAVKVIWGAFTVTSGYILLRSMNHLFVDEFPGILSYPFAITCVFIKLSVILTMSAGASDLGRSFLDSWSLTKQTNFRRILMSCPGFQIWSARFYFITVSSTITCFMQVFGYITDCVITFP